MLRVFRYAELGPHEREALFHRGRQELHEVWDAVRELLADVRERGDQAVAEQVARFDGVRLSPDRFRLSEEEIEQAFREVPPATLDAIREQIRWSRAFHEAQRGHACWMVELERGVLAGQMTRPIPSTAIYVPGGRAAYPTVAQILTVAASVAGVPRICVFTPPRSLVPEVVVAARLAGAHEIYRVGGVAAIAAAAYGTETIRPVDKIVGPGNVYVQAAKLQVLDRVACDIPAGPSEVLIIADETARPDWCAADLLAQAEHDPQAAAVLVTHVPEIAWETAREVQRQVAVAPRREVILQALSRYSCAIISGSLEESLAIANDYAAEHLQLYVADPFALLPKVQHAGCVFLGAHAPVAVGDYATGVNHTLPTGRWARVYSAVGIETFQKKVEFQYVTREGLARLRHIVYRLAAVEQLPAHGASVAIRFGERDGAGGGGPR